MLSIWGNTSLLLSLCFSLLQILNSNKKNNLSVIKFNKITVIGLLFSSSLSFFLLMYGYIVSDFSLINVFQNSHSTKPLIYKIAGVWGNHEGSMLLWTLVLSIFNYFLFKLYDKKNYNFISKSLETQSLIIFGFLLFTIITSNPFEKIIPTQENGLGFNPILQDPALVIHPPLLYVGYVGFSAAFSLCIATLNLENNEKIPWNIYMKPFVTTAWTFLTIGITFGSVWAYYELGWGGWWFWDPVENASLMPWLIGTALLHSLIIVEKKKSLQSWVLLLSILAFLLSLIGTFLVRSGILTSVHTFALDPGRGIYILGFATFLTAYSLILYSLKSKNYFNNNYLSFFSREGSILVNNIIMVIVCASIFLGTIYPLLIEAFTNNKISVGEPYYNSTVIPILVPAILIMGIGPMYTWIREPKSKIIRKIFPTILCTTILTIFISILYRPYSFLGILGVLLGIWIISNNIFIYLKNRNNQPIAMIVAHIGIGILILGITASSQWQEEKIIQMKINDEVNIKKYNILFKEVKKVTGTNFLALEGNFLVYDNEKKNIAQLNPQNRYYPVTNTYTTEASIHTNLIRDLYIVIGEGNFDEGWTVRIYYNPLVIWIWIGAFTIFFAGIFSTTSNLKKIKYLS